MMNMNPALATVSTGIVPAPANGAGLAIPGAEGFAEVMAGVAALPVPTQAAIGTDAKLRFDVAPAEADADGVTLQPAHQPVNAKVSGETPPVPDGIVAMTPPAEPAENASPIRRKRDAKDAPPELTPGAPPSVPVVVPIAVAPATAAPAAIPMQQAMSAEAGFADQRHSAGKAAAGGRIAAKEAGKMVKADANPVPTLPDRNSQAQTQMPPQAPASPDSRKSAEPMPPSLTAVADIVQNLPPLIQSQVGAAPAVAPSAAVRPAMDVGASLSSQVIDMGVGGQWIDRVAKEITALAQGNGHSRFQLSPPNLGRLQIDVWQGEGGGRVQLLTETDEAAMRLQQDRASLQADARLSALSIDRIVIERAPGGFGASPDQGTGRQHQAGGDATDRGNSPSGNPAGQQAAPQQGQNGGGATGQGKAAPRRDVFNDHTQPDVEDRGPSGRADDRHVRYA